MADRRAIFDREIVGHIDAAYNFARWIVRNDADAEDVVQESLMNAWRAFARFQGGDAKPWLMAIVRNACFQHLRRTKHGVFQSVDEELPDPQPLPDAALIRSIETERIHRAIAALPEYCREVLILREMENMAYNEIAQITGTPIGTVMSRLSRARAILAQTITQEEA